MKIYLAGPMRGYPEFNFPAFARHAALLRAEGHEVFSPAEKSEELEIIATNELENALAFRRRVFEIDCVWICREADAVAMMPGWENSSGSKAEWALAVTLGLKLIYLEGG